MKTPPIATKFVKHEVPPLETLKDSPSDKELQEIWNEHLMEEKINQSTK